MKTSANPAMSSKRLFTRIVFSAVLPLIGFSNDAHADYIPNENFEPVWIGTNEESTDGPDRNDFDGDTLENWLEQFLGTDVWNLDSDGDGMPDGWEVSNGLNPDDSSDNANDPDGDFILNIEEYQNGSDPQISDFQGAPSSEQTNDDATVPPTGEESPPAASPEPAPPAPEPTPPAPEPTPPLPETLPNLDTPPPPPESDPYDLPWYEDLWNGVTSFVETYIWSNSPVDAATFNALEGTASLVDPLTERQQAIQGLIENVDNAATIGATNSADPADYTGSNGTVEPN